MPLDLPRHCGYSGKVYPVNPKYQEVFGYPCYPEIEALPEPPDLVVLAIGAEEVTPTLERCHRKGVPSAIVYAAGFAEADAAGAALQRVLEEFAARTGMGVAALPLWNYFYNWHRPHHGINLVPPMSRLSIPRKNLLTLHN